MLVVQDIFLTETAYLADVILPASAFPEKTGTFTNTDRLVQLGRQALAPPGEARQDLAIIDRDGDAARPALDTTRIRATCSPRCARRCRRSPASRGSGSSASTRSPIRASSEGDPGERVVFTERFPTRDAAARGFVPATAHPGRRAARRRRIRSC